MPSLFESLKRDQNASRTTHGKGGEKSVASRRTHDEAAQPYVGADDCNCEREARRSLLLDAQDDRRERSREKDLQSKEIGRAHV